MLRHSSREVDAVPILMPTDLDVGRGAAFQQCVEVLPFRPVLSAATEGRAFGAPHSLTAARTIGFLQYRSRQAGVHHLVHTIDIRVQKKRPPLSTGAVDESLPIIHPAPVQP
jgi:hypothetical protein